MGEPPYLGGIENVVDTLANSSLREIYDFKVFDTHRIPDENRTIFEKAAFACKLICLCSRFFVTYKPDLVHIHFCSNNDFRKHAICLCLARILRIKTLFHLHGGDFEKMYNGYSFFAQKTVEFIFRIPHCVIALSDYWKNFLSVHMSPQRLEIINNPIDCEKYSPTSGRNNSKATHKVLLLGRIGRHKGHYDTLKALPIILENNPNAFIVFAGNDEVPGETDKLKIIAEEINLTSHVQFLGPVTGNAKIKLLHSCSIMILPSYGENMPLSVMEGMAAMLPLVATSVGAIPELFEKGELGILIEPGDHIALADAINWLLDNPKQAENMAQRAHDKVNKLYDTKKIAAKIDNLYKKIMKESTSRDTICQKRFD